MSFKDAAEKILRRAKKALHYEEITRLAIKGRLIDSSGRTPGATMIARLGVDVNTLKGRSRFIKVAPGVFGINPHPSSLPSRPRKGSAIGKPGRIGFVDKPVDWNEVVEYLQRACRKERDEEMREELFSELLWAVGKVHDNHREMATKNPQRFWRIIKSAVYYHGLRFIRKRRRMRSMEIIPRGGDATLVLDCNLFSTDVPEAQARIEAREAREEANARLRKVPRVIVRQKSKYHRLADEECLKNNKRLRTIRIPEDSPFLSPGAPSVMSGTIQLNSPYRPEEDPPYVVAKSDPTRDRNTSIRLLREADSDRWTYRQLADKFGIKSIGHVHNIIRAGCPAGAP